MIATLLQRVAGTLLPADALTLPTTETMSTIETIEEAPVVETLPPPQRLTEIEHFEQRIVEARAVADELEQEVAAFNRKVADLQRRADAATGDEAATIAFELGGLRLTGGKLGRRKAEAWDNLHRMREEFTHFEGHLVDRVGHYRDAVVAEARAAQQLDDARGALALAEREYDTRRARVVAARNHVLSGAPLARLERIGRERINNPFGSAMRSFHDHLEMIRRNAEKQ